MKMIIENKTCAPYEFIEISRSQLDTEDNEMLMHPRN